MGSLATLLQKDKVTQPLSSTSPLSPFVETGFTWILEGVLTLKERIQTVLYRYPLASIATSGALVATLAPLSTPLSLVASLAGAPSLYLLCRRKQAWLTEFHNCTLSPFQAICETTQNLEELVESLTWEELSSKNDLHMTLLHTALATHQFALATLLAKRMSAELLSTQDMLERTALHWAIAQNQIALAKQLAVSMYPEHLGLQDEDKALPLHLALLKDETEDLSCSLIERMSPEQLELPYVNDWTPLHRVISRNQSRIFPFLVKKIRPSALEKRNQAGNTPFDLTLVEGELNTSLALIQKATPSFFSLKNPEGKTVMYFIEEMITKCKHLLAHHAETERETIYRPLLAFFQRIRMEIVEKELRGPNLTKHLLPDAS